MYRVFPSLKTSSRPNPEHQGKVLTCTENPVVSSLPTTCSRKRNETDHVPFASKKKERKKKGKKETREGLHHTTTQYNKFFSLKEAKRRRKKKKKRRRKRTSPLLP
jgi:hypothetical protein